MLDNQLIQLFLPIIKAGLVAQGYAGVAVVQSNQATQQGVNSIPTVYFYKIGDKRYGFLQRADTFDSNTLEMVHTESQYYETTFQINALVTLDITNVNSYTASDLVNVVAGIMQSDATRNALENSDVGILRVTDVRNPYFVDDRDNFEASPSFDFTLIHAQTTTSIDEVVSSVEAGIYRV